MMWPPSILRLRIRNQRHNFGLWLPLFLFWPLALLLALLLFPFVLVAAVVFWYRGWTKPLLLTGPSLFMLFCAVRGLEVDIKQGSEQFLISLR